MDGKELDTDVIDISPDYDVFQFDISLTDSNLDEFIERLRERKYVPVGLISDMDKATVLVIARKPTKESQ